MTRDEIITELQKHDSTVLSFPDRGPWGSNKYRGNCSGWIQAFLIWKYKVQKFAELFSGSGTGYDVCKDMGVPYVGADLNPIPVRPDILNVNAVTDEVPTSFYDADMIYMHPPYGAEINIPYAGAEWGAEKQWEKVNGKNVCKIIDHTNELIQAMGYDPKQYDLGRMNWEQFMQTLNEIVMKYYSAMMNGGTMAILMGDVRRNGFHSMLADIVKPGQLEQVIIKMQHNTVSERSNVNYAHKNFVPLVHEYIMVVKKLVPYMIEFQFPQRTGLDIRNSNTATWKDVVMAYARDQKHFTNTQIANDLKNHEKAKRNQNFDAKLRQTCQILEHAGLLMHPQNGEWRLAAC